MHRRIVGACGATVLAAAMIAPAGTAFAGTTPSAAEVAAAAAAGPMPQPLVRVAAQTHSATPPTTAQCLQAFGLSCYSPLQFQQAYNLSPLYHDGYNGRGQTIVIVDSFGYAGIGGELAAFDKAFGLRPPPSFKIIQPAGKAPAFNPKNPMMVGWAQETSLDVEYSHAIAPGANIVLVETPVAETLGVHGFPQIIRAENYVVNHHLGNVISQSFAATEQSFASRRVIYGLRSAYINAARHGVSVLAGSGDSGATAAATLNPGGFAASYYLHPAVSWPATDPLVTALGGTQLHLMGSGKTFKQIQPATVWNDTNLFGSPAASGGGRSVAFSRPSYQNGVRRQVGYARGVPDISMSAAVDGAALVYLDAGASGGQGAGFSLIGGTSEATPQFAGIVAIADQMAGHGLGLLNPSLYKLEAQHASGLVDVTAGTNTVTFPQGKGNPLHTVFGWDAAAGYDLASGTGTINAASFVPQLVAAAK